MSKWKTCTISDIGTVVGGATPSTKKEENYLDGTIPWITPKDLAGFSGRYIARGERNITEIGLNSCSTQLMPVHTILFSSRAPIGYVAIAENEVCTNQGFKSVIPNADTDYMFLYYLLKYNKNMIENLGSGTTFKEVSGATMRNVEIKVPETIEEQKKIASILSALDDKIENNNAINDNLLQQALCLYSSLIGESAKNGYIGDYCSIKSGFAFKSKWWQDSGVPVVKIGSINQDYLNLSDCSYVSEDKIPYANDFIVSGGDLLIAMTGATIGKFTMVPKVSETILVNQRVGKFFLGEKPIAKLPFIYCTLKQPDIISEVINRGQGSAQPNISATDIMTIPCVMPNTNEIDQFNRELSPMFEMIINNQYENTILSNTRDAILPMLMSGELDVSNIDI
ncbi:restriction endonuclease subunit S [Streptococcus ruminicola]|uniref:restriction endonuclease subunit S n=1 Tax=Streptococcus ruminicola TaxID=2686210 RepID=UPI002413D77B|nr:restriction endonuclease subunit S [Streptococcus ruminicola]WFM80985.1 restriction endonuclease subunit S [Streptococcus ruminicola]